MKHFLRDCDILIFAALDVDAIDHFDGGSPEACSYHAGKNILAVLGGEDVYDQATGRDKLDGSISGCGTRMHVSMKEPSTLFPLFSIWHAGKTPIEAHPEREYHLMSKAAAQVRDG
jgi:hypothetical protein